MTEKGGCIVNKNKVIALICTLSMMLCTGVSAEKVNEPKLDIKSDILKIDGNLPSAKPGRFVTLLVTNPGVTIDNYKDAEKDFQHKMTVKTDEKGYYCFNVAINSQNIKNAGDMSIYVGGDEFDENVVKTVYYAPQTVREDAIKDLNEGMTAEKLQKYEKILSYKAEPYTSVNKEHLAGLLNEKKPVYTIDNVVNLVLENALLTAYNDGMTDLCIKDNAPAFNDIIKIENTDKEFNCTVYTAFTNSVNAQGKAKILSSMLDKKTYKTIDDLKKQFIKSTVAIGVSNGEKSGYEHVLTLLTSENASAAGINISDFLGLDSNKKAEAAVIIMNSTYSDEKALESAVQAAYSSVKDNKSPGGGNSGGSTGSSSGNKGNPGISIPSTGTYIPNTGNNQGSSDNSVFSDIDSVSWAKEAILNLNKKNILSGVGNKKFEPNSYVTREQIAKIITTAFEYTSSGNSGKKYKDSVDGAWYEEYVRIVSEKGIMNGQSENSFGIGEKITRQDLAVVIARALGLEDTEEKADFKDFDKIPDYAKTAVIKLSKLGIITGFEDGTFRGSEPCTRAQAAVIIDRALKTR